MSIEAQKHRRSKIYALHRRCNRRYFRDDGRWLDDSIDTDAGLAREMLWHAMAFMAGDTDDVAFGNTIICQTPHVSNHFNPVAAASLWSHYEDKLSDDALDRLSAMINDNVAELVDFGLGMVGLNNYSSMLASFFLATSEHLETYEVPYKRKSIPEVYNRFRLRNFGMNMLRLMQTQLDRTDFASEFNSPTYSPITLWGLSEIICTSNYEPARQLASQIARRLWKELLGFHHPCLRHTSGPHSRAYLVDSVGHGSNWKSLCAFTGIDEDNIENLLYSPVRGQVITGEMTFRQSVLCWLIRPDYQVPQDLLAEFESRTFPYSFQGSFEWAGKGFKDSKGNVVINVDGDYKTAGGKAFARCYQDTYFSIGSMSETHTSMNHPCQIVYQLNDKTVGIGDTRSITAVMLTNSLTEETTESTGAIVPGAAFDNNGLFRTEQKDNYVKGSVEPYHWAPLYRNANGCDEISFNVFISEHLPMGRPVENITLNRQSLLELESKHAEFIIVDGRVKVTCKLQTLEKSKFQISRHGGFLRCSAILYKGDKRFLTTKELAYFKTEFEITVEHRKSDTKDN